MTTELVLATGGLTIFPDSPEFEATACFMAREYQAATAAIAAHLHAVQDESQRLRDAFTNGEQCYAFDVDLRFHSDPVTIEKLMLRMKREAWGIIANKLAIRNLMSIARRREFDQQLENGELPDITEETITDILLGLVGQVQDFAKEAAAEVFEYLRPVNSEYKTNNRFRVGRRVILKYAVTLQHGGRKFWVNYHKQQHLTAIDGVFHLLAGRGPMRENRGPLCAAIESANDGRGETDLFSFRACKNGNLHLEFKQLDLVKELNRLATGERVLGSEGID